VDVAVLDTPGLYSDEVSFNYNPRQQFYLSNNAETLNPFWVDDFYDIYIDGFQVGRTNGWNAAFPFKARQGQTLNIIATNTSYDCRLGTLYALLVDEDNNVIGSHLIYEATQLQHGGPASNGKFDYVDCSNGIYRALGVFMEFDFILDFPDAVAN
jgi:hypothetical protein